MAEDYYEKKARELLNYLDGEHLGLEFSPNSEDTIQDVAEWLKDFKQEKANAINVGIPSKSESKGKGIG